MRSDSQGHVWPCRADDAQARSGGVPHAGQRGGGRAPQLNEGLHGTPRCVHRTQHHDQTSVTPPGQNHTASADGGTHGAPGDPRQTGVWRRACGPNNRRRREGTDTSDSVCGPTLTSKRTLRQAAISIACSAPAGLVAVQIGGRGDVTQVRRAAGARARVACTGPAGCGGRRCGARSSRVRRPGSRRRCVLRPSRR